MSSFDAASARRKQDRPPFEMQNLHLLKDINRSHATYATAYLNSRDPNYMNNPRRPQNLHILTERRGEATLGRCVLMHQDRFALEEGKAGDALEADDGPPDAEPLTPPPSKLLEAEGAAAPAPTEAAAAEAAAEEAEVADDQE